MELTADQTPSGTPPNDSAPIDLSAEPDLTALSGLELMRLGLGGAPRRAGIGTLLGMVMERVDEGEVEFSLVTTELMTNPMGMVHGGIAATLLDSVLGCAVHTTLAAGEGYTTTDLHIHYVRGVAVGEHLTAVGTVVHRGRRMATAEGRVTNAAGKLVAHATTTCMLL